MNKFSKATSPLFRYLLRELSPEEEGKIKSRLLADEDYAEQLKAAEAELIDAYVWKYLTKINRKRFEKYFLCSQERREKLRLAVELYENTNRAEILENASQSWIDRPRRWLSGSMSQPIPAYQVLAAGLVIGLGILTLAFFYSRIAMARGLNALNDAYSEERPIEPWITGFGYARYFPRHDGGGIKFDLQKRGEASRIITDQTIGKKSPEAYHALGKLYLTEKNFREAMGYFDLALQNDNKNAKLHNDLAVALMEKEKAKIEGESTGEGFAEAVEHLHRAIELDNSLLEAHFNLALCHQYQMLWRTAVEDWKKCLEKDSQSLWAEEVRQNLKNAEEQVKKGDGNQEKVQQEFLDGYQKRDAGQVWQAYRRSRLRTGSFITNRLIDDYLSLALSRKSTEASDKLQALLFIGNIELERVGDRFTYDLAQYYGGASLQQLQTLSEARNLVKSAYEHYGKAQIDSAINEYQQAKDLFNKVGDVGESLMAQHVLGHCYFRQANTKASLSILTQGSQDCEIRTYKWLLTMYLNDLANANLLLTKYSRALEHGLNQVTYAKQIEDDYGILRGLNRVTEIYMLLARSRESLSMIQEGLSVAGAIKADAGQYIGLYSSAARCYLGSGKLMAALDYQKEALKLSLEINNPWLISRHYTNLGLVYSKLNKPSDALGLIQQSGEIGKKLQDRKMGREIAAFSQLYLGEIYREIGDLDNSVKSYKDILQLFSGNDIDNQWLYFGAKKGILLTHIKQGDAAATEEELKQIIDLYEEHRKNIEDESSRNSFFDNEQGIYDIAIEYAYFKQQNVRRAFDFSEMSRARSLLDTIDLPPERLPEGKLPNLRIPYSIQPMNLGQIQSRLPDKVCLLQYVVLDDKIIVWAVSKTKIGSQTIEISQDELNSKVAVYINILADGLNQNKKVDHRKVSSDLYNLLIKPVENEWDKDAEICIIPDKILNRLPFVSLISPTSGKYLVEERPIYVAPSANMFLVATDKARQKENVKTERLLSIGNPWFDRAEFRNLKNLPWATTQASEIATFYPNSIVLLEKDAKEIYIKKEIEKSDVAHFAMHYVADERTPLLSALPLAEERVPATKDRDGILQTFELYNLNLSKLRLVVLSACQTGIEQYYKGEGAIGLARAFQGAGIPLVVASLWPVESYPTRELMVSFHKHRKRDGLSTAQALRQAQLDMIRSADPELRNPYHWAAYTVIGGHAKF